jgi:hypothetical protein
MDKFQIGLAILVLFGLYFHIEEAERINAGRRKCCKHFRPRRRWIHTMQHSDLIGAKHAIIIPVGIRLFKAKMVARLVVSI